MIQFKENPWRNGRLNVRMEGWKEGQTEGPTEPIL